MVLRRRQGKKADVEPPLCPRSTDPLTVSSVSSGARRGWRDFIGAAPWMSTGPRRECQLPPGLGVRRGQPAQGSGGAGSRLRRFPIQFLFQRRWGPVSGSMAETGARARRRRPLPGQDQAEHPSAAHRIEEARGNNAAGARFWNVNAWTRSIRSGNEAGSRSTGERVEEAAILFLFQAQSVHRGGRAAAGCCRAVSSRSAAAQLALVEPLGARYTNPAKGAEHGEQQRRPGPELGELAHHQTRAAAPTPRAPNSKQAKGQAARPGRRSAAGRRSGRRVSACQPRCCKPPTETSSTSHRRPSCGGIHNSGAVPCWRPAGKNNRPRVISGREAEGGAQGGGHARRGDNHPILAQNGSACGWEAGPAGGRAGLTRTMAGGLRLPDGLPLCPSVILSVCSSQLARLRRRS